MSTSLSRLQSFYHELKAPLLLHAMITREFPGSVAVLTSFGRNSGLLLSMVAAVNPATPVLFLNTAKHFAETLDYAKTLAAHLRLTDVRWLSPDPEALKRQDPEGDLWRAHPERCCALRKTEPLSAALETMGFLALVTGRTHDAEPAQSSPPKIELDENGVFRINPLAGMTKEEQNDGMMKAHIPPHPLAALGYDIIGCEFCTRAVYTNADPSGKLRPAIAREDAPLAQGADSAQTTADWSV